MPARLTDTAIQSALRKVVQTGRKDLTDQALPGLRLRLTPAGGASWVLACRDGEGRMRRFPLGAYPALGIAAARDAARAMREAVRKGADPIAERQRRRQQAKDAKEGVGTLAALLALYGERRGKELKSWVECKRRVEHVFARHLQRPLASLTISDLQLTADQHPSGQSAAAAVRYLRPILKWAVHRGYVPAEVSALQPPATVGQRRRVLSREELTALLPALDRSDRPYARALRFMLLTLARREEVCAACWRHVDTQAMTWTIPETKNGEPHVVPLSRQALALLQSMEPGKPAALIFATMTGGRLRNWDRETKAIQEASGTSGWTRHDLRRTGATMLGEMGELPDIIEAALNHVSIRSPLAATYNRARYRPQVAAALQRLADALDGIQAGRAEVVPLREHRSA